MNCRWYSANTQRKIKTKQKVKIKRWKYKICVLHDVQKRAQNKRCINDTKKIKIKIKSVNKKIKTIIKHQKHYYFIILCFSLRNPLDIRHITRTKKYFWQDYFMFRVFHKGKHFNETKKKYFILWYTNLPWIKPEK